MPARSDTAFSVGAVIVGSDGEEISRGYSRETSPHVHAEESALAKLPPGDPRLVTATIYSTLEPCSERKSSPVTCLQHILNAGIPRVVVAWREPSTFVADCQGCELLEQAGVTVVELPEFRRRRWPRTGTSRCRLPAPHVRMRRTPRHARAFWY